MPVALHWRKADLVFENIESEVESKHSTKRSHKCNKTILLPEEA